MSDPAAFCVHILTSVLDSTRFPGFTFLSEYKVHWEGSKVTGLPPPKGQTDYRPAFFLQVGDKQDEVQLVKTDTPDPNAQLLTSVPRAFLYEKKHLVLFDTATGCVHIILDFGHFNLTQTKSRTFKRENLPFEAYFKCGKTIEDPNPNRCSVIRGTRPGIPDSGNSFSSLVKKGGCLLAAVLAVGLLYAIVAKKKEKRSKRKSAVKSTNSSSAVSGTRDKSTKSTSKGFKTATPK